jgi:putative transposase
VTETWLDTPTTARITGDADRTVRLKCANRDYASRMNHHGRRGRPQLQVALSSLPAAAQMKYARLQLDAAECHALVPVDPAQPTLFTPPAQIDVTAWSGIPDDKKQEARQRLQIITPLIEWNAGHRLQATLRDGRPVTNTETLAQYLGEQHECSRATIWNYYTAFKKEGIAGLARKKRSDASTALQPKSRYFERHPEAAAFVLAKYGELGQCSPTGAPNLALVFDELMIERRRQGSAVHRELAALGEDPRQRPSIDTVRNFLGKLPPVVRDAARLTREKHDARYAPTVRTNIAATRVNQFWVSDHRVVDILGFNDCFADAAPFSLFRVWCTAIEDMRSRVIWSVFSLSPSWKTIASALRVGMSRYGKPETFYCDNGKDFKKVGGAYTRAAQNLDDLGRVDAGLQTTNLLQRLGIIPLYCLPKHPRSKMIESAFNLMSQRCDVMFGAGYAGNKPSARPDQCRDAEKQHHAWMQGKADTTPFLPLSQIVQLLDAWFEERNQYHQHSGDGMNGRTPYEVMRELLPNPQPVNVALIEPLFWEHKTGCTVQRCAVRVDNETYEGIGETDRAAMYAVNGQEITVAYDPYERSRALAIVDRRVVAELQPKPRIDRGLPGQRSAETDLVIARTLREGRVGYNRAVMPWTIAQRGVPTLLDGLRDRNQIAAPLAPIMPAITSRATAPAIEPAWPEDEAEKFLKRMEGD